MEDKLQELEAHLGEIDDLNAAGAVLAWDQMTYMPPGGAPARARQVATLKRMAHERLVDGTTERISEQDGGHAQAISELLGSLGVHDLGAVGHRVVHGGERFFDSALITDDVLEGIAACVDLAPLHNPANLAGIRAAMASLPHLPHVAVFDTAFHTRMPARARTYALDAETAGMPGIRR